MAFSRYTNTNVIEGKYYETVEFPSKEELDKIETHQVSLPTYARLDILAKKYLGNEQYWWILALMNDIDWGLGQQSITILRIPKNVQDVLRLF